MTNAITTYRPGLLGRGVFDDIFDNFFTEFPRHLKQSTQGYPVADIYTNEDGGTVMEFALAGFTREELSIDVQPDKRSVTVSANAQTTEEENTSRRIARRSFTKTYVNYDDNLDLSEARADFQNGLLTVIVPQRPEITPVSIQIK